MQEKEDQSTATENIALNSAIDKEAEVSQPIHEKNKQKKKVIKDDNLSNQSICHTIFYNLKNDSCVEKQDIKTATIPCHGKDINLYPP